MWASVHYSLFVEAEHHFCAFTFTIPLTNGAVVPFVNRRIAPLVRVLFYKLATVFGEVFERTVAWAC